MHRLILIVVLFYTSTLPAAGNSAEGLRVLLADKKYTDAIAAGEQLLGQQPASPDVQFLTAYAYQMNQQNEKAAALYQSLISQHPELPEPRNNLAMIYLAKGDYDAASKLLVEAINTHNSYATAYQNLSRIYTGIASEAYRRAVSEEKESTKYTHNIELAALSELESVGETIEIIKPVETVVSVAATVETTNRAESLETLLTARVKAWATAWGEKDFSTYTSFYSTEHHPDFATHSAWVEYRRQRIMRPGFIKVSVDDFRVRAQNHNRAIIDFKQAFDSPGYSDRVVKRLGFKRVGAEWKIIQERVLSVL